MMNFVLPSAIRMVGDLFKTWIGGKIVKRQAEAEITQSIAKDRASWERYMAEASSKSWKDELIVVWMLVIMSCCFIPSAQPYMRDGFAFIKTEIPDWFAWGFLLAIASSFGIKGIGEGLKFFRK